MIAVDASGDAKVPANCFKLKVAKQVIYYLTGGIELNRKHLVVL